MFKKFKIPSNYLVMIRTTRKDGFNRIWDAKGETPQDVIDSLLDLSHNDEFLEDLAAPEVVWVDTQMPSFNGYSTDNFGVIRNLYSTETNENDQDREYNARYFIASQACSLLANLERVGRYAELWEYERTPFIPDDDPSITVDQIRSKASQFQLVINGSPTIWKRFQKREIRNATAASRRREREDRKWDRAHAKAVKKGNVTSNPALHPEVDMLDPHTDGTLREGDVLFDALMEGKTVMGTRTPKGWDLEGVSNDSHENSEGQQS